MQHHHNGELEGGSDTINSYETSREAQQDMQRHKDSINAQHSTASQLKTGLQAPVCSLPKSQGTKATGQVWFGQGNPTGSGLSAAVTPVNITLNFSYN